MRTAIGVLLGLVPAVYLVLLAIGWERNRAPVELQLFFGEGSVVTQPVGFLVLGAFLFGVALAAIGLSWPIVRGRMRLRRESKRVARLEQEVHGLRMLPLHDDDDGKAAEAREA